MYNIFLLIHFHVSIAIAHRCVGYVELPSICIDIAPPLYNHPCTRFALLNTFHVRAYTWAISVNDLLILVDGSNVLTVYYITVFMLAYVFALCRSQHRKKRRKSYGGLFSLN
jgi:hypothetical protein